MSWGLGLLLCLSSVGCKSADEKKCDELVKSAEVTLLSMNPTDEASVSSTLSTLRAALDLCQTAKSPEVSEIQSGISTVERHLERLKKGEIKTPPPPRAQDLANLEKEGDPGCPRGQGYQHPVLQKYIKCSGPTMLERNYSEVVDYFLKHQIATATKEAMIRGTQAGITYTFHFDEKNSKNAPVCLGIVAPQDKKVAELISFASSVAVDQIDPQKALSFKAAGVTDAVEVPIFLSKEGELQVITLGDCETGQPLFQRATRQVSDAESGGKAPSGAAAVVKQPSQPKPAGSQSAE